MIDDGLLTFLFSPAHDINIPIHKTIVSTLCLAFTRLAELQHSGTHYYLDHHDTKKSSTSFSRTLLSK